MQPNQPSGSPQQNPYEFITNPGQAPKKSFGAGGSFAKRILVVVGGAAVFMIIVAIVISLLTPGNQGATQAMKDLVLEQQDIVLLSTDGAKEAIDPSIRALAITSQLSAQTDQTNFSNYLDTVGSAVNKKTIPILLNTETTAILDGAKSSNRYDEVFEELLISKITQYQTNLKTVYDSTSSEDAKTVLSNAFTSASNLLAPPVASE